MSRLVVDSPLLLDRVFFRPAYKFILDSLLLFYDAFFRPVRLQHQLNEWVPPDVDNENTSWWRTILLPTSRQAWRVWALCLPWWLAGVPVLVMISRSAFSFTAFLIISGGLLLTGWSVSVFSPPLGLVAPVLLAFAWDARPERWLVVLASTADEIYPVLTWQMCGLPLLLVVLDVGLIAGVYRIILRGCWRWARAIAVVAVVVPVFVATALTDILVAAIAAAVAMVVAVVLAGSIDRKTDARTTVSGVAFGVGVVTAVVLAGLVAGGIAGSVTSGLMIGVVAAIGGGVAGLSKLPSTTAWPILFLVAAALGRRHRWWVALLVAGALSALRAGGSGWLDAGMVFGLCLLAYYRLPLALAGWLSGHLNYRRAIRLRRRGGDEQLAASALRLLQGLPPFADETTLLPVPHLDHSLALIAWHNRAAALQVVEWVAHSYYQAWAVPRAYAQITAITLAKYRSVEAIAQMVDDITWLPQNLMLLGEDIVAVWPRLQAVSRDVHTALASDSVYNRRLGLGHAQEDLNNLRQQLPTMGKSAVHHWQPVVDSWVRTLGDDLEQWLLTPEAGVDNPYVAGNPLSLRQASLFRGRGDLADAVVQELRKGSGQSALVLYGPRRMGKTSFLLQLPRLLQGRVVPVFVDLQRPDATESAARFLYTVARAIVRDSRNHSRIVMPGPALDVFEREPFVAFADWLEEAALPALRRAGDFTLLLSLDEFEELGRALKIRRVNERVLGELRYNIQHRDAVNLLFAGVHTLEELGPHWSSYFINVRPLRITYLCADECEDLVRNPDPRSDFSLEYADEAVGDILTATHCHPYLVQLVCSVVVELANRQGTLFVTRQLVHAAQLAALGTGELYFRNVWEEATGADSEVRAAGQHILRQVAKASSPVNLTTDTPAAFHALERLLRRDVLERAGNGIHFQVPLLKRWVRECAPASESELQHK